MKGSRKLIIEIKPRCVCVTEPDRRGPARRAEEGIESGSPRDARVATALRRALDQLNTRARSAVLILDGASSFSKRILLPPVRPEHIERAIAHEAGEHIPFPLEEVVWDVELIETHPPEALLVAAREDVVDGLARAVTANGLRVERMLPATVAWANAVASQYDCAQMPAVLVAGSEEGVDIICYDGTRFVIRSLPPTTPLASVDREADLLAEKLGNPAGSVRRLFPNDAGLSVVVGALCEGPIRIDLSPAGIRRQRMARRRMPPRIACLLLIVAILGVWIGGLQAWARADERRRIRMAERVELLQLIETRMRPLEGDIQRMRGMANAGTQAMERAAGWHTTFMAIHSVMPEGMYLLGSEPMAEAAGARGVRVDILSYTDREPEDVDPVRALRDSLRALPMFSAETRVHSRPSRGPFARVFTLEVMIEEERR